MRTQNQRTLNQRTQNQRTQGGGGGIRINYPPDLKMPNNVYEIHLGYL